MTKMKQKAKKKDCTYLLDPHVHTGEVSPCGNAPAAEMVKAYTQAGYQGIVITDHYGEWFFKDYPDIQWQEMMDVFLSGYSSAKKEGDRVGLDVFLGMEINFQSGSNDYLVFGMEESFLYENPYLDRMDFSEFSELIIKNNFSVFQAHPMRNNMTLDCIAFIHGIEVLNGNKWHDSQNDKALEFARLNHIPMIGGSDAHSIEGAALAGVCLSRKPENNQELAVLIRDHDEKKIFRMVEC